MSFIFNLAWRELRSSWRRLLFFFLCIGIGVGSIVALRSMIQSLNRAVAGEARALMTADVQVDTTREWPAEARAKIERIAQTPLVEGRTETIEAPTMLRPSDASRGGALMVELNRRHGTTLVLVTHDAELAARADRRISLRDGRVVADETSDESVREETGELEEAARL